MPCSQRIGNMDILTQIIKRPTGWNKSFKKTLIHSNGNLGNITEDPHKILFLLTTFLPTSVTSECIVASLLDLVKCIISDYTQL